MNDKDELLPAGDWYEVSDSGKRVLDVILDILPPPTEGIEVGTESFADSMGFYFNPISLEVDIWHENLWRPGTVWANQEVSDGDWFKILSVVLAEQGLNRDWQW